MLNRLVQAAGTSAGQAALLNENGRLSNSDIFADGAYFYGSGKLTLDCWFERIWDRAEDGPYVAFAFKPKAPIDVEEHKVAQHRYELSVPGDGTLLESYRDTVVLARQAIVVPRNKRLILVRVMRAMPNFSLGSGFVQVIGGEGFFTNDSLSGDREYGWSHGVVYDNTGTEDETVIVEIGFENWNTAGALELTQDIGLTAWLEVRDR